MKAWLVIAAGALLLLGGGGVAVAAEEASDAPEAEEGDVQTIGTVNIHSLAGAYAWTAGVQVDGDGAPDCYGPNGGRDFLNNARKDPQDSSSAFSGALVLDDSGNPILNSSGYYLSGNKLTDSSYDRTDQRHFADASQVAFLALGPDVLSTLGAAVGDLCYVVHLESGSGAGGVVGDIAPRKHLHEVSIALAVALGVPSSPKNGGAEYGIGYVLFPGSGAGWPNASYQDDAAARFSAWGGLEKLRSLVEAT